MITRLKAVIARLRLARENAAPSPLPTTDEAVAGLIRRSIEACGLDPANDSLRQAIATTLLSLPQGSVKISVNQLRDVVNQARCKQAAYSVIEEIRTKDKVAKDEAADQKAD